MATKIKLIENNNIGYIQFYEESERKPCTLDWNVLKELNTIIDYIIANDEKFNAVIVESLSKKYFIVGANIEVLKTQDKDNIRNWVDYGHETFNRFSELKIPVIAKIQGYALGGGLELAMACDMIFATPKAKFGQPEASLGVIPGWGGSYRLVNLIGLNRAKEMFFTGNQIDANKALDWGLINDIWDEEEIDNNINEILLSIKKNDKQSISIIKDIISSQSKQDIQLNKLLESQGSSICMASEETLRRMKTFFDKK